jgi:hypothetical protein
MVERFPSIVLVECATHCLRLAGIWLQGPYQ